jgi:hypothetical protein
MVVKIHVNPIGKVPKYIHKEMRAAIDAALVEEAEKIDGHWDTIFSGFENRQPSMFTSKVKKIGYDREIWVYTARATVSNGILSIINYGLGPRPIDSIPPKNVMVFPREYSAATIPNRIFSRKRKKFGDIRRTRHVKSHTIRARRFDLAIVKRRKGYFKRIVQNKIDKAAKRMFV